MVAPLDADPELSAALGRMVGAWSHLEYRLTILFSNFLEIDLNMGAAIFDFFKSTPTQVDVLRRVSKLSPRSNMDLNTMFSSFLTEYTKLATKRNRLAHNPFGWTQDAGEVYIMEKTKGAPGPRGIPYKTKPITITEINTVKGEIDGLAIALLAVIHTMPPPTFARMPIERQPDTNPSELPTHPTQELLQEPLRPPIKPKD